MSQNSTYINIYRKASEDMLSDAELEFTAPVLSYLDKNEKRYIEDFDLEDGEILVNKYDENWTPEEHNLKIVQRVSIKKPELFFGEHGIVAEDNSIGLGVHLHSSKSFFQQTEDFGTISLSDKRTEYEFQTNFPLKTLRGEISFDFFMYLKEKKSLISGQAKTLGLKLCEEHIQSYSIIVDGAGSDFPILDFTEKGGPLWKIERHWVDSFDDRFDSSNVYLAINTEHSLFDKVKNGKNAESRALIAEIMMQSLAMIIHEVVNIEEQDLSSEEIIPGTILMAVKYWVETFEVETDSMYSITNSLRKNQGDQLYGG